MSNEAAERLRSYLVHYFGADSGTWEDVLDAALAAERKATVERIRAALMGERMFIPRTALPAIRAILDAEAER